MTCPSTVSTIPLHSVRMPFIIALLSVLLAAFIFVSVNIFNLFFHRVYKVNILFVILIIYAHAHIFVLTNSIKMMGGGWVVLILHSFLCVKPLKMCI